MNNQNNKLQVPPPPRALRRGLVTSIPTPTMTVDEPAAEPQETPEPQVPHVTPNRALQPSDNMSKANSGYADLNFKVAPEFRRAFKLTATVKGMQMKELLEAAFQTWVERYGDEYIRTLLKLTKEP